MFIVFERGSKSYDLCDQESGRKNKGVSLQINANR